MRPVYCLKISSDLCRRADVGEGLGMFEGIFQQHVVNMFSKEWVY